MLRAHLSDCGWSNMIASCCNRFKEVTSQGVNHLADFRKLLLHVPSENSESPSRWIFYPTAVAKKTKVNVISNSRDHCGRKSWFKAIFWAPLFSLKFPNCAWLTLAKRCILTRFYFDFLGTWKTRTCSSKLKPAAFDCSHAQVQQSFDWPRQAAFHRQRKPAYEPCEVPLRLFST